MLAPILLPCPPANRTTETLLSLKVISLTSCSCISTCTGAEQRVTTLDFAFFFEQIVITDLPAFWNLWIIGKAKGEGEEARRR